MTKCAEFLNSLSPATRLLGALLLVASALILADAAYLLAFALALGVLSRLAAGGRGAAKKKRGSGGWVLLALGLALVAATQLFWTPFARTGTVVARTFVGEIWTGSIASALALLLRVAAVVAAVRFAGRFLDPAEAAEGLEAFLAPLGRVGLRPEAVSTAFAIAMRFSQLLAAEARQLVRAQRARGIAAGRGPLKGLRSLLPLVLPIFVLALSRAERLAVSMESRCFGLARRERVELRPSARGAAFVLAAGALVALSILSLTSAPAGDLIRKIASPAG